ncbi:glycosyltransferase family 4 protein [bacterium]|nr:glycosyltransferase family 4 protein [bacterium]
MTDSPANRPLRIFHINMHLKWGGQPNRVLMTSEGLRTLGHHVCVSGPRGAMLTERARAKGFDTFEDLDLARGFKPLSMRRDVRALRAHFEEQKYDVIDTHGSQDTWAVAFALRGMADPPAFVRTRHNTFPVATHLLNRWLYRKIDHIITISPQVIPLMAGLKDESAFTPIYSAPDPKRFDVGDCRDDVRTEFGIAPDEPLIGVVARLAPEKGHRYLLEAAPQILAKHPKTKFLFIGTGRSRTAIEEQVEQLDIKDRVILTGFREDVPRLLQGVDLFVLPPDSGESLGTSILEAFLMKRPVVATDVGGVRESVRDGETGRLVPPAKPDALAEAIIDQLDHPDRAKEWALAGHALVQEIFTPENIARQTEAVYRKAIAARGH